MKRLFYDIETSPLVAYTWRAGYKINIPHSNIIETNKIICICWKWEGHKSTNAIIWDENQNDKSLLEKFIPIMEQADEIVAHNGDNYDLKFVRTRALYHGLQIDETIKTFDTLKESRKLFRFNSNKLDYIAQYFNLGKKSETGGFELWVGCLKNNKESLDKMVQYCKNDVVILEKVFKEIYKYAKAKQHVGVLNGEQKWSCKKCGSTKIKLNGSRTTQTGITKHRVRCTSCNGSYTLADKHIKDFFHWFYNK